MSRRSKVSSVASSRVHNSYIHRATVVNRSEEVDPVEPIKGVRNKTASATANYLTSSDAFYDQMDALREEYKNFYHDHKKLQEAVKNFHQQEDTLIEHMKDLIEKYNRAVASLQTFDKKIGTNHVVAIQGILWEFQESLEKLGIQIQKDGTMDLEVATFIQQIEEQEEPLGFLFEPIQGMVIRLYRAFRSIKIPGGDAEKKQKEGYRDLIGGNIAGVLMDSKT